MCLSVYRREEVWGREEAGSLFRLNEAHVIIIMAALTAIKTHRGSNPSSPYPNI